MLVDADIDIVIASQNRPSDARFRHLLREMCWYVYTGF